MRNFTLVMAAASVAGLLTACSAPLPSASQAERASAISVAVAVPEATPPSDFGSYATALSVFGDPAGQWSNFAATGVVPPTNPFFLALGSNKRTCGTCHNPNNGWTESPTNLNNRFTASNGNDPIFASLDGTNCPSLNTATLAAAERGRIPRPRRQQPLWLHFTEPDFGLSAHLANDQPRILVQRHVGRSGIAHHKLRATSPAHPSQRRGNRSRGRDGRAHRRHAFRDLQR